MAAEAEGVAAGPDALAVWDDRVRDPPDPTAAPLVVCRALDGPGAEGAEGVGAEGVGAGTKPKLGKGEA